MCNKVITEIKKFHILCYKITVIELHILYGSKPRVRGRASRWPNAEALPIILSFFFFFRFDAADLPALRSRSLRMHDGLLGRFRGQLGQSHVCRCSH